MILSEMGTVIDIEEGMFSTESKKLEEIHTVCSFVCFFCWFFCFCLFVCKSG